MRGRVWKLEFVGNWDGAGIGIEGLVMVDVEGLVGKDKKCGNNDTGGYLEKAVESENADGYKQ